jgi:hypothetical protein
VHISWRWDSGEICPFADLHSKQLSQQLYAFVFCFLLFASFLFVFLFVVFVVYVCMCERDSHAVSRDRHAHVGCW